MISAVISILAVSGIGAGLAAVLVVADKVIANYGECTITINDDESFTVDGGGSLLDALVQQKIFIPSACGGKATCGYCKVCVEDGAGTVLPTEEPFLSKEDIDGNIRLSCQVKVKNDLRIRIPEELLSVQEFHCTVEKITPLTEDIREFRFRCDDPAEMSFIPGQYIQLLAPEYGSNDEEVYRAYSISSDIIDKQHIELVIRLVPGGICTTYCFDYVKEGDSVRLNGPYGEFRLSDTDAPMIMIAGGSGMAPIKCILHHMVQLQSTREATFYFGANNEDQLFYRDEMKKFEEKLPNFRFVPVISNPSDDWKGESGLVTEAVGRHADDLSAYEGYLCGSPGMIDASVSVLTGKGVPEEKIYYDKFS